MATSAQLAANQANAQLSTGPGPKPAKPPRRKTAFLTAFLLQTLPCSPAKIPLNSRRSKQLSSMSTNHRVQPNGSSL